MKRYQNLLLITFTPFMLLLSYKPIILLAASPESEFIKKNNQPCPYVFSIYDIDKSGSLNREEYRYFIEKMESQRKKTGRPMRRYLPSLQFEEIDINKDGYITEDEMIIALNKRLHRHRRNHQRRGRW